MGRFDGSLLNKWFDLRLDTVFNVGMATDQKSDKEIIAELGGPSRVAELLNYPKKNGPQRVNNWLKRGIPARVLLDHPEIFGGQTGKAPSC